MTINWKQLMQSDYWLGLDVKMHRIDAIILYGGAALVLFGVIILIMKYVNKDPLKKPQLARVSSVFITIGLLEMFWYLLRGQYVNILGARVTAAVIAIFGLIFLFRPLRYFIFKYRKDAVEQSKVQLKEKYINMNH